MIGKRRTFVDSESPSFTQNNAARELLLSGKSQPIPALDLYVRDCIDHDTDMVPFTHA
jgi:hypothetical protein